MEGEKFLLDQEYVPVRSLDTEFGTIDLLKPKDGSRYRLVHWQGNNKQGAFITGFMILSEKRRRQQSRGTVEELDFPSSEMGTRDLLYNPNSQFSDQQLLQIVSFTEDETFEVSLEPAFKKALVGKVAMRSARFTKAVEKCGIIETKQPR